MNLLITGAWDQAKDALPFIQNSGHAVVFMQREKDALPCAPEWVEGVVCNALFIHHPIHIFPNLRYIQLVFTASPSQSMQSHVCYGFTGAWNPFASIKKRTFGKSSVI